MRPFEPSLGIHLDIWPAQGVRQRTKVSTLTETLALLPELRSFIATKHPGVATTFLITGNGERVAVPPILIDSDACSDASVIQLASRIRQRLEGAEPPTHYSLSRRWGLWDRVTEYRDQSAAFHLVFLFPGKLRDLGSSAEC